VVGIRNVDLIRRLVDVDLATRVVSHLTQLITSLRGLVGVIVSHLKHLDHLSGVLIGHIIRLVIALYYSLSRAIKLKTRFIRLHSVKEVSLSLLNLSPTAITQLSNLVLLPSVTARHFRALYCQLAL
jgi:hypothetical protein